MKKIRPTKAAWSKVRAHDLLRAALKRRKPAVKLSPHSKLKKKPRTRMSTTAQERAQEARDDKAEQAKADAKTEKDLAAERLRQHTPDDTRRAKEEAAGPGAPFAPGTVRFRNEQEAERARLGQADADKLSAVRHPDGDAAKRARADQAQHAKVNAERRAKGEVICTARMVVFQSTNEHGTTDKVRLQAVSTGNNAEDNTYAREAPTSCLDINIDNPFVRGKLKVGDEVYVDISLAPKS